MVLADAVLRMKAATQSSKVASCGLSFGSPSFGKSSRAKLLAVVSVMYDLVRYIWRLGETSGCLAFEVPNRLTGWVLDGSRDS